MNDDLVQPHRGFGKHPHRDAEICTYVVEGELTHADTMGTKETLGRGAVQFMTAGRGVAHSEHNLHPTKPLRFIQMWFTPRERGLKPNYGSLVVDTDRRRNRWAQLVHDAATAPVTESSAPEDADSKQIGVQTDIKIFAIEVEAGQESVEPLRLIPGRQAYLLCVEGNVSIILETDGEGAEEQLEQHDAAELFGPGQMKVKVAEGTPGAHLLLVEMAYSGPGRRDLGDLNALSCAVVLVS